MNDNQNENERESCVCLRVCGGGEDGTRERDKKVVLIKMNKK